jgi:ABC-type glycerol-3-phosphate transport system substrate-binding protein
VAWDHQARLIEALRASADDFVAFPAPTGPKGLGFMPVVTGLAIPKTAPDAEGAKDLIRYLTDPKQTATVARELGFFPATAEQQLPEDLDPHEMADSLEDELVAEEGLELGLDPDLALFAARDELEEGEEPPA